MQFAADVGGLKLLAPKLRKPMFHGLLVRAAQVGALFIGIAGTPINSETEIIDWMLKGALTLCAGIIAYFLKGIADSVKENGVKLAAHDAQLQLHNVMFEQWLSNLSEGDMDNAGRRDTDKLIRALMESKKVTP